uniref:Disease resistance N-terminal domain-containing protein n=1 Tax=Oryza rufipogon TaxID=4529 RepID=A0A0E0N1T2_ORYRU
MNMLVPAAVSDIAYRLTTFAIKKYQQLPDAEAALETLNRLLLRAQTIIEEAEGKCIANEGMLHQLRMLTEGMYRGHYLLDRYKYPALQEDRKDEELACDIIDQTWQSLKSSMSCWARGSKIIITSRSDKIENLGTTAAIRLDLLHPEAYWYLFKMLAFGSRNPDEHPKLASVAMEIATEYSGSFLAAYTIGGLLRDNFNAQFWCSTLKYLRAYIRNQLLVLGDHPNNLLLKGQWVHCLRFAEASDPLWMSDYYETDSCPDQAPNISDIMLGSATPRGRFEALGWKSRMAPYYSYMICCSTEAPGHAVGRKKRSYDRFLESATATLFIALTPAAKKLEIPGESSWVTDMETFLPAILSDLLGRSISYLVQRYRQQSTVQDDLEKLRLALVRVHVTVEEAEARHITNKAMLRQLDVLREAMYSGYHMLDALTYRAHADGASFSFAPSRLNAAKRLRLLAADEGAAELRRTVDSLGRTIADMREFVVFLKGYPRISTQPYSMHLLLDKLMFGRQKEVEQVVGFLLQPDVCGAGAGAGAGVLHIVGVARVGKSTLVEHVCHDERVRGRFSSIVCLSREDLEDMGDHRALTVKHGSHASHGSSLVVVDLAEDEEPVGDGAWRRLRSSAMCRARGSRIIVTSRSPETVRGIPAARAIELKFLRDDVYWYFFKVLAFGSANPDDHPRLASIAMDISAEQKGGFIGATIASSLMRANPDAHYWTLILKNMREYTRKHRAMFGKHPHDLLRNNHPVYLWRLAESSKIFLCHGFYTACPAKQEIPRVTFQEVLSGRVTPRGRFEVLAWTSQIPPCRSYLMSCSLDTPPGPHRVLDRKKRLRQLVT